MPCHQQWWLSLSSQESQVLQVVGTFLHPPDWRHDPPKFYLCCDLPTLRKTQNSPFAQPKEDMLWKEIHKFSQVELEGGGVKKKKKKSNQFNKGSQNFQISELPWGVATNKTHHLFFHSLCFIIRISSLFHPPPFFLLHAATYNAQCEESRWRLAENSLAPFHTVLLHYSGAALRLQPCINHGTQGFISNWSSS